MRSRLKYLAGSTLNSYSQVFFSDNRTFALLLLLVSFADLYAGMFGLLAVLVTNITGMRMGFDERTVSKGLFGFNSLLVALALGIYYEPGLVTLIVIVLASLLTLFISVSMQGIIGKYGLPYLSVPFILGAWIVTLAAREFTLLGVSERGIFTVNELYILGGHSMVRLYDWWNSLEFFRPAKIYFISLGAILFQYNIMAGIVIAAGILYHSRIAFTLSLTGFFTAYLFYELTGANISELSYSYIGFNYILTSIAIGGFFVIPSWKSYAWSFVLVPVVAMLTISLANIFEVFRLPVFALPFNIVVLLFLYVLKFRVKPSSRLAEVVIQQNSPEKNLYSYVNDVSRFRPGMVNLLLPFYGKWDIMQGHDGEFTHIGDWRYAWDFVIKGPDGKQFKGEGNLVTDYHCYNRPVIAPGDGIVEHVIDDIADNIIGSPNTIDNWGNSVIIRHNDYLFSSMSHLVPGSATVKVGDRVRRGDIIGRCGNSGRSPYPHLHYQVQHYPFIGSATARYPFGYYILDEGGKRSVINYGYPARDSSVMNVDICPLLKSAFDLVPGRKFRYSGEINGKVTEETWEVFTDEYNNSFLSCSGTGSRAYFVNDGNRFIFRHFQGSRGTLLYWFFLAVYRVQFGFYQDMVIEDDYPVNLFFRRGYLFLNDFIAPFLSPLKSKFRLKYSFIDSEIAPSSIKLQSASVNMIWGRVARRVDTEIDISAHGVKRFSSSGNGFKIVAECEEK